MHSKKYACDAVVNLPHTCDVSKNQNTALLFCDIG
jgi:hypothetical protein